jgi:DNA-binding MarR family transcriptional regulator
MTKNTTRLTDNDVALADNFVAACVRLTRKLRHIDRRAQLTPPQSSALAVIIYAGEITMSDLAALEQVSRPSITITVRQLELQKFVTRKQSRQDRRVSFLKATQKGRKVFFDGQRRRTKPLAALVASLAPHEKKTMAKTIAVMERFITQDGPRADQ